MTIDGDQRRLVISRLNGDDRVLLLTEQSIPAVNSKLLSWREWQVIALVEEGKSNAEIAAPCGSHPEPCEPTSKHLRQARSA